MLLTLIKDINFLSIQPFSSIGIAICYGIKKKQNISPRLSRFGGFGTDKLFCYIATILQFYLI